MHRKIDRSMTTFSRRFSPRYCKVILTFGSGILLFSTFIYMTVKYISNPVRLETTVESTTTTTTTSTTTAESTTTKSFIEGLGCFYDQTNITLSDGSIRSLNKLTIGDEVLIYSSNKKLEKSRILTIFHYQRSSVRFLDIYTRNNFEPLRLTPSHSILTRKRNKFFDYDFASNIEIGDFIYSSQLKPIEVINIKEIILYNQTISTPLTYEGNIIVNNLIGSCYGTFSHQFMHLLTIPIRYWYQIETHSHINSILIYFIDIFSEMKFF